MQGLLVFNYSSRCCNNRCISNISINLRANKQRTQLQKRKVMHRNRKNASEQHLLAAWPTQLQHLRQHRSNCNEPLLCIATVFFFWIFFQFSSSNALPTTFAMIERSLSFVRMCSLD